jgi:hypothetical protein
MDDAELLNVVRHVEDGNVSGLPGCTMAYRLGLIDRRPHPLGEYAYFLTDEGRRWLAERPMEG